ncbi:MFS transporter [Chloroflexota bacterium]
MNQSEQQYKSRVIPVTSIITFLAFLDTTLLLPIIALYTSGLGTGIGITGLIIGLYSITNTPANILFGRLIDRIGYRIPLVTGLIGDTLSMFLYSVCRLPVHLGLVRAFHGISGGLVGPATMSIFSGYQGTSKGRAMAFYGMSLALANLVGFGLSGILASRLGYNAVFFLGGGLLGIGVILSLFLPGNKYKTDITDTPAPATMRQIKELICRKSLIVSYCSVFAHYFTFGGVVTLLPIYLKSLGMEAVHVGALLASFSVTFIIIQFPSGVLSDRAGRIIPAIAGLVLGIVALIILPSVKSFPVLIVIMGLYGIAFGLLFPSISAMIAENTRPEERGLATGIFHALLTAGVAIGAPVIGWLGGWLGVQQGLILTPAILALALLTAIATIKRA